MELTFTAMTADAAREALSWRYDGPYAVYNTTPDALEEAVAVFCDPANAYFAARAEDGALAGWCCFGPDARVPGGDYADPDALDVGIGLRPDLTGQGRGLAFFRAVLAFGRDRFAPARFRLTVAAFNARARRVYAGAGFRARGQFRRGNDPAAPEFILMIAG